MRKLKPVTEEFFRFFAASLLSAFLLGLSSAPAFAAAGSFTATSAVSAGDVVVWDSATDYGIRTTTAEAAQLVAGVAVESVAAGNPCIVRQDGGRVAVNVVGTVARGQWLITSTTAGKARGVDALQAGVFGRALTGSGVPVPGKCYASIDPGLMNGASGSTASHSALSNLNWSAAGHTFDAALDIGSHDFQTTGQFSDGANSITAAEGEAAYDHSQTTANGHGLTYSTEGSGGGLDADTVDGSHSGAFAAASHTHTEAQITDLEHNAQKVLGKAFDSTGIADGRIWKFDSAADKWIIAEDAGASGSGAPVSAPYITQTPDATLTNEQALSLLGAGLLKNTTGTGVLSIAAANTDYVPGFADPDADRLVFWDDSAGAFAPLAPGDGLSISATTISSSTFVDRGDPAAWDFNGFSPTGDFITDGAWHDLDLSTIVPAGAKAVLLRVNINDDVANQLFMLRENGNSNSINALVLKTQVANISFFSTATVACDVNRVIEYYASNTTWTTMQIAVGGWFL